MVAAPPARWLQRVVVLNVGVIALQPLALLVLVATTDGLGAFPVWGRGIVLTWALSLSLWAMLGSLADQTPARVRQVGFIVTAFVLPLVSAFAFGDSLAHVAYDLACYHSLGTGVAFGLVLTLGPGLEVEVNDMRLVHVRARSLRELLRVAQPVPVILLITVILLLLVTLPPIAAEVALVQRSTRHPAYWVSRYLALGPEVLVLYGLFLRNSIYGRRRAPADAT